MPLVACPDCYRQISDVAPVCIGCGRPMTSHLSQPPTGVTVVTAPPPKSAIPMVIAIVAMAGALGAVLFAWRAWAPSAGKHAAATAAAGSAARVGLGDTGVLRSPEGLPTVMLFESRDDFDAAEKATLAKDDAAYKQLVRSRATFVPAGTHAREIEAVLQGGVRVLVLDGPHPGYVGWTDADSLQPN